MLFNFDKQKWTIIGFVIIMICRIRCNSIKNNDKDVYNRNDDIFETSIDENNNSNLDKYKMKRNENDTRINTEKHHIHENNSYNINNNMMLINVHVNLTSFDTIDNVNITEEPCIGDEEFCSLSKEEYVKMIEAYIYPQTYEWALIATHSVVFVIGLIGNALVCAAVYRNNSMRTVTNYFIVNLAIADFMVILFCLPPTVLWDVTETWFLGDTLCKILVYFQSVSVTVSILTLTFISVDRWYAICFPLKFKSTTGRAKTAIIMIWFISLAFNSPEIVVLTTVRSVPLRFQLDYLVQCTVTWTPKSDLIWHIVKVLFIYTMPLLLMSVAYYQIVKVLWKNHIPGQAETVKLASAEQCQLRSRKKAAKMLVAVVVMFAVCYFPVHLLSVLRYTMTMAQTDVTTCIALISHVLCYANSAINPLIYNFMSGKFRREFRRAFCCASQTPADTFTSLTRVTTARAKRPCTQHLLNFDSKSSTYPKTMDTSFTHKTQFENGGVS